MCAQTDLLRCKVLLHDYFNTTFPKAAEVAEMHRAEGVTAGRESPGSVMVSATNMAAEIKPPPMKSAGNEAPYVPMDEGTPTDEDTNMDAHAPEYCFSPVR